MTGTLHLIADPLCGWCFGAAPLLQASQQVPELSIKLHCGGLFSGANRQQVDAGMRQFILSHHERIKQLSTQDVGAGFIKLIDSGTAILDSDPPIRAILAAEKINADCLKYYQAVVQANFIDGKAVVEEKVLQEIAVECGLDPEVFKQAFDELDEQALNQHIADSRALLQQVGGQGFPTFALEQAGEVRMLNHQRMYNNPDAWKLELSKLFTIS